MSENRNPKIENRNSRLGTRLTGGCNTTHGHSHAVPRHSRGPSPEGSRPQGEGGNPPGASWTPAFAGVTRTVGGNPPLLAWLLMAVLLAAAPSFAQVATGSPPYASFSGGPFDSVNNANLNVHFAIPVVQKAGRGLPFNYVLSYDSSIWAPVGASGNQTWTPVGPNSIWPDMWGWRGVTEAYLGSYTYSTTSAQCVVSGTPYYYNVYSNFAYHDSAGTVHSFGITTTGGSPQCNVSPVTSGTATATDGSGLTMSVTNATTATVYTRSGEIDAWSVPLPSPATRTDSNGNQVSWLAAWFTDTLNARAVYIGGPPPPYATVYSYTAASGNQTGVTVSYKGYFVMTNFGCSGIAEYGLTAQNLVSEISLADGTSYTFTYEATPGHPGDVTGRLASVTLPTGGTITYSYSGGSNGITCADGSTATLERTTPDGTWTYAHTENGTAWTTTLTDPRATRRHITSSRWQARRSPMRLNGRSLASKQFTPATMASRFRATVRPSPSPSPSAP